MLHSTPMHGCTLEASHQLDFMFLQSHSLALLLDQSTVLHFFELYCQWYGMSSSEPAAAQTSCSSYTPPPFHPSRTRNVSRAARPRNSRSHSFLSLPTARPVNAQPLRLPAMEAAAGAEADHSEVVATFCSITGASSVVAAHYLDAYSYDLDRSLDFYYANPPDSHGLPHGGHAAPAAPDPDADLEVQEGMPGVRGVSAHFQPFMPHQEGQQGHGQYGHEGAGADMAGMEDEDEMLQRALAASLNQDEGLHGGQPGRHVSAGQASRVQVPDEEDEEGGSLPDADAELEEMGRMRERAMSAHREAAGIMEGTTNMTRSMMEGRALPEGMDLPSMFPGLSSRSQRGPNQGSASTMHYSAAASFRSAASGSGPASSSRPGPGAGGGFGTGPSGDLDMELPDGVDAREIEEARMLEAAMLGVEYTGPMADLSARPAQPSRPVDPHVREGRGIRWEQDYAYEESLAADRAKAEAAARAQADAERVEREAREAVEAEVRRAEEEAAALKATLERKRRGLAAEPGPEVAGSVNIMVRLPDGSRQGRRFLQTDPLQAVFDFIDVQHQGGSHLPGSYNLIVSYPRKVLADGSAQALQDVGITADTALFLEPRKA